MSCDQTLEPAVSELACKRMTNPFLSLGDYMSCFAVESSPRRRRVLRRLASVVLCLLCLTMLVWPSSEPMALLVETEAPTIRPSLNFQENDATDADSPVSSPFTDFLLNGQVPWDDRPPLLPLQMLETYISQHSAASLLRDWQSNNTEHRRFAIIHYSCPQQLGNRLHHFYNDFLLAFLTNRTILWRFWDREACIQLGNQYDHSICSDANRSLSIDDSAGACNSILRTAPWLASYEEWSQRLSLPKPVQVWIRPINPHNAPHPPPEGVERLRWLGPEKLSSQLNRTEVGVSSDWKTAVFQPLVGVLGPGFVKKQLTQDPSELDRVASLFTYGSEFWYGLLFDHAFLFDHVFLRTIKPSATLPAQEHSPLTSFSIALHSRHIDPQDDGTNVTRESSCLKSVLDGMMHRNLSECQVLMLSDRPQTLAGLETWILEHVPHCTVVRAQHLTTSTEHGLEVEHGPFAGAGFVQDLVLASRESSKSMNLAWIGHDRSSSKLLLEWVVYRRAINFWKDFGKAPDSLPKLSICQVEG